MPKVPLVWRVPNAPATFVGRREELRAVARAHRRGPVVVLCGAGGLGKTALASAAVRELFADRAARAVMVGARAGEPFRQAMADVLRALGHAPLRSDADDLTSVAIDLAEARRAIVVIDDVHHALAEATEALVTIARYARRAVWIATSRVAPEHDELAGQIVRLEPLGQKHLAKLARIVDPKMRATDATRIAREAAGSPWRARKLASDRSEARVGQAGKSLLATLSVAQRPISSGALAKSIGADPGRAVKDLVQRGLVEEIAGGYRLHEEARTTMSALERPEAERARAIAALASGGDADALEALRLALEGDDDRDAIAICASSFDAMLRAGHASALWKMLGAREDPAWNSFKLRAAMQLADVKITTLLDEPPERALRDRLLWIRALSVESKAPAAAAAAERLHAAAKKAGDETVAFWAALERAMASRVYEGPERGLALLDAAKPNDGPTRALASALSAFWHAEVGRVDDAIRTLERSALGRVPQEDALADEILGGPLDFFVRYYRMAAFMECGHLDRAHDELTAGRATLDVDDQLRASYVQLDGIANLSIARGKLDEAARILERLLRSPPAGGSTYHTIARLLDIERRLAAGGLGDVARDLDDLFTSTRIENPLVFAWCHDSRERLHLAAAVREEPPLDLDGAPLGAVARSVLALRRALRRARWGEPHELPDALDVEGRIVRALVLATDALVAGRDATDDARAAVDLAEAHGWGVRECEARLLLAEAHLTSGDSRRALSEARAVGRKAQTMASPRFEGEAQALAALVDDPPIDAAALEALAIADDVSPCAARRARAILGDDAQLDAADRRVIDAARAHAAVDVVRVRPATPHRRGWGLDLRRRAGWLPDGRRVSFARHALLARVLEVLARHDGVATFEQLSEEVWQRRTFHPLHDGNRIRVTLHRLRALVEDDPQAPTRVVLAASAYELGGEPFTLVCPVSNS
ncbi:MAG TPA: AAA family ATPase [Polyangiaceae bacterium]|jgi:tetratricopeptide (TPR) repeat protein